MYYHDKCINTEGTLRSNVNTSDSKIKIQHINFPVTTISKKKKKQNRYLMTYMLIYLRDNLGI